MYKIILLMGVFLCVKQSLVAQKFNNPSESGVVLQLEQPTMKRSLDGTFQFIVKSPDHRVLRNQDFEFMIESNRKDAEDVFMKLDDDTVLYIPSKRSISAPEFHALPEYKVER